MSLIKQAKLEDAAAIAHVHVESWRTTYAGLMPDEVLADLSVERREQNWRHQLASGTTIIYVAESDTGEIVGFVSGGVPQTADLEGFGFDSELYAIYLLKSVQGTGIGRLLAVEMARHLYGQGYQAMLLWVLQDNLPARQFYERLSGEVIDTGGEKMFSAGGVELSEVAYGWRDLLRFPGITG